MGKLLPHHVRLLKDIGSQLKIAKQRAGLIPAPFGSEPRHSMVWGPVRHLQKKEVARLQGIIKLLGQTATRRAKVSDKFEDKIADAFTQQVINKARVKNHPIPTPTKHKAPGPYDDILPPIPRRSGNFLPRVYERDEQSRRFAAHEDFTKGIIEKARGETNKVKPALHTKSPKIDEKKLHSFTQGIIDMARGPKEVKKRQVKVSGPYDDLLGPKRRKGSMTYEEGREFLFRPNPYFNTYDHKHLDWLGNIKGVDEKTMTQLKKMEHLGKGHAAWNRFSVEETRDARRAMKVGDPIGAKIQFNMAATSKEKARKELRNYKRYTAAMKGRFGYGSPKTDLKRDYSLVSPARNPRKLKQEKEGPYDDMFRREDSKKRLKNFTATGVVSVPARRKP